MKTKALVFTTVVFFLVVNTSYYWETKLGRFAIPAFLFLGAVFLALSVLLIGQFIQFIKEKAASRARVSTILLMTLTLGLIVYKPAGLINFAQFGGKNLLIAEREGSSACGVTFTVKPDNRFIEKSVCFGTFEVKGRCEIVKDTLFFSEVSLPRGEENYYQFAVLERSKSDTGAVLIYYRDRADTTGRTLWVIKNELMR